MAPADIVQQAVTIVLLLTGFVWVVTRIVKAAAANIMDAVVNAERTRRTEADLAANNNNNNNNNDTESVAVSSNAYVPSPALSSPMKPMLITWASVIVVAAGAMLVGLYIVLPVTVSSDKLAFDNNGLILRLNDPDADSIPYYTAPLYINEIKKQQVPMVDCRYHHEIDEVHEGVLKSIRQAPSNAIAAKDSLVSPYAVDTVREEARTICVTDPNNNDTFISLADAMEVMSRPDLVPLKNIVQFDNASRVRLAIVHVLMLGENGSRNVRVVSAIPKQSTYVMEPRILNLDHLIDVATELYDRMRQHSKQYRLVPDPPCLCLPHFGIVGSGLFLKYNDDSRWQVVLHPKILRNLTRPDTLTRVEYGASLRFPYYADAIYGVGEVSHYNRIEVQYIDPFSEIAYDNIPTKVNDVLGIKGLLPLGEWRLEKQHLLEELTRRVQWTGDEVSCFYHCNEMENIFDDMSPPDFKMYAFW